MIKELVYTVFIIIHGTWGADGAWYLPGGDFFTAIEQSAAGTNASIVPFRWSGENSDSARKDSAQMLARLIQSYPSNTRICIVAHSHGGNVAILASQHLTSIQAMCHRIDALYLLGTPAQKDYYRPDMHIIKHLYNIISFEDMVQSVVGFFGREQPQHPRIANLRIIIEGKEPDHTNIHHSLVGKWLLYLDQQLHTKTPKGSFKQFIYTKPGTIHIFENSEPEYEFCVSWTNLMERDSALNSLILNTFSRAIPVRYKNIMNLTRVPE